MDKLTEILESLGLSQDDLVAIKETFDSRVAEAREEAELAIREELSARFEHDKANLVEATDRLLSDVVAKFETQKAEEIEKLSEAREKFKVATNESRTKHKEKLKEHISVVGDFASKKLAEETIALKNDRKKMKEAHTKVLEAFKTYREKLSEEYEARIAKVNTFVIKKLTSELQEFNEDHQLLIQSRAQLVTEGRKKIAETQQRLVKESAAKIEKMVNATLKSELQSLHEDIERNRKNDFGKRLFEAFAAEYSTSHLNEGSEVSKLNKINEGFKSEIDSLKTKLNEQASKADEQARKVSLAEQKYERALVMNELLGNLRGEKRQVMESMLERVQTRKLRESYSKFLPTIINGSLATDKKQGKLMETENRVVSSVVTGDQRANRLNESVQTEDYTQSPELENIIRLAGVATNQNK